MKMKYIPNMLSIFRIIFSGTLLLFRHNPVLFIVFYFVIGVTDALDGNLARRFHWQSERGAKLDGIGDVMFALSATISLLLLKLQIDLWKCLITIFVIIAFKLAVLVVTKIKIGEWNAMHTYMVKLCGVLLYLAVPIFVLQNKVSYWVLLTLGIGMCLASIEETIILYTEDTYNANHKGLIMEKFLASRKRAS